MDYGRIKMYDIIVIGAGPSGSAAAKISAESGRKVLLTERFKLPRYKSCSGMIIKKTVDLVKKYFKEDIPESVTCLPSENRGMVLTDEKGKEYIFEQKGFNVWRSNFDFFLTESAINSGAELKDGISVISLKETEDRVTVTVCKNGRVQTIDAQYVINCEGVTGSVKRKLTGNRDKYITTFQTFNKGTINADPHYFYAYLNRKFSEYDAWFNVKDNQVVLGVAVEEQSKINNFYLNFTEYMKMRYGLVIEEEIRAEKWIMPKISPDFSVEYGKGRILFAGETAGFLNPMGEGISAGIESGAFAAKAVTENFGNLNAIYESYIKHTEELRNYMKRQWNFIGSVSPSFKHMKRDG